MNLTQQTQPLPGDYYGTIYKGGFIVPILIGLVLVVLLWWFCVDSGRPSSGLCGPESWFYPLT